MCKINLLRPFAEFITKLNREKAVWALIIRKVVLNIAYIAGLSTPRWLNVFIRTVESQNFHAILKQTLWLV